MKSSVGDLGERPIPTVACLPYLPPCPITTSGNGPTPAGLRIYAGIGVPSLPWNSSGRPSDPSGRCSQLSADITGTEAGADGASEGAWGAGFIAMPAGGVRGDGPCF